MRGLGADGLRDFTPDSVTGVPVGGEETQMHVGVHAFTHMRTGARAHTCTHTQ